MTAQITLLPAANQPPDGNAGNNLAEWAFTFKTRA